jgi:hypothetical protein
MALASLSRSRKIGGITGKAFHAALCAGEQTSLYAIVGKYPEALDAALYSARLVAAVDLGRDAAMKAGEEDLTQHWETLDARRRLESEHNRIAHGVLWSTLIHVLASQEPADSANVGLDSLINALETCPPPVGLTAVPQHGGGYASSMKA